MNYSLAFSFVKDEKDWMLKLLITGLISLIPIIGQLYFVGWLFEIARRVTAHETVLLPDVNFSTFVKSGFKLTVITIVYLLPGFILTNITQISIYKTEFESRLVRAFFTTFACFSGLLNTIIGAVLSLFLIAAYVRFFETSNILDAFNIIALRNSIKKNVKYYLILWLFEFLVSLFALVGLLFCFVGILFTFPYCYAVWGHLFGQMMQKIENPDQSTINP